MLEKALRRAGSNALRYFPVRLIPALTSLITLPVFTHFIDKTDYGDFSLITATTSLVTAVTTGWISSSVVRFYWIARKDGRQRAYTATALWVTVAAVAVGGVLTGIGFWLVRGWLDPGIMRLVPVAMASFAISALYATLLQVMRAANRAKSFAALSISMTLVTTVLSLLFVWKMGWGSLGILAGGLIGHAVLLPFILRDVAKEGTLSPTAVGEGLPREFATYGVPLMLAGLSSWMLVVSDRYVIGFMRGAAEVGLYAIAYSQGQKIMEMLTLPLILTMSPLLIETFERDGQELAVRIQTQFSRYFVMATMPLFAGMVVAGPDFMHVFTDKQYWPATGVLPVVAFGVMCNGLAQLAGSGLGMHKKSKIIMGNTFAAAGVNVIANLLTVGRFGYTAAAYNTLLAYAVLLGLTWWRSRPYMAWDIPWADLTRITLAAAVMGAALYVAFPGVSGSPWLLVAQALSGIVVYAAALLLVRALRPAEIAWIREIPGAAMARLRRRGGDDT